MIDNTLLSPLRTVIDPEMGINIVDLGLIYGVERTDSEVRVRMTMTTAACPMVDLLSKSCEDAIFAAIPGVNRVLVDLVWDPPWRPELMSDEARRQLNHGRKQETAIQPTSKGKLQTHRLPMLALGFVSLMAGLITGLFRLDWTFAAGAASIADLHGPLMVSGFLGTVIGLERAVALRAKWAMAGPIASGLGCVLLLVGPPADPVLATALLIGAGGVLLAASIVIVQRQPALFTIIMALGAASWVHGNVLWLSGTPVPDVAPWWMLFLILTIAGERLDLSRLMPSSPYGPPLFIATVAVLVLAAALAPLTGIRWFGMGMVALALWFARFDIARKTVSMGGVTQYVAVCLLTGYVWLGLGGLMAAALPGEFPGMIYDPVLHSVFLGFVFAMIFGHAPIILPAVLGVTVTFQRIFYAPLVVMGVSLAARVIGDLAVIMPLRRLGGLGGALAIVLFILVMIRSQNSSQK